MPRQRGTVLRDPVDDCLDGTRDIDASALGVGSGHPVATAKSNGERKLMRNGLTFFARPGSAHRIVETLCLGSFFFEPPQA